MRFRNIIGGKRKLTLKKLSKKHNKKSKKNRKSRKGGVTKLSVCKDKCQKANANDIKEYQDKNKSKSHAHSVKECKSKLDDCIKKCNDEDEERKRNAARTQGVASRVPVSINRTQKRSRVERDYDRNPGSVSPMRGDTPEPPAYKRSVPPGNYGWRNMYV